MIALRDAAKDRGPDLAGRRLQSPGRQTRKSAVGSPHESVRVHRGDRHRRRIEDSRKPNFGGAQILARGLARASIEHQRARRAGKTLAGERDAVENADRQEAPASAFQIDVELLGRHFARPAGNDRYQRRAVGGHDIRQFELARRELREIIVEPPGERRIHVGDRAVWLRREKAGGRVVEIVDHMLQVLKKAFVPFAFARDVGDGPERRVVFCDALERAHPDAIPGRAAFAGQRRRDAQFLDAAFAGAGRLRETIDRFGNVGRARKQPLDGTQVRRALGGGERAIGVVGVEDARMGVGDDQAIVVAVRDRLRGVRAGRRGPRIEAGRRRTSRARTRRK